MTSAKELLIPRYIVIAEYPNTPFLIGDIIRATARITRPKRFEVVNRFEPTCIYNPEQYPAIFKPLKWCEHRRPDEHPAYVQFKETYIDHKKGSVYAWEWWTGDDHPRIEFRFGKGKYDLAAVPMSANVVPCDNAKGLVY